MNVLVDTAHRTLNLGDFTTPCVIGRGGAVPAANKREGDGATPLGRWPCRGALLRPDTGFGPPPMLPWRWIRREDGWCDDPTARSYNRPVSYPLRFEAERLWRADGMYDAIVVIGHNDSPPVAGKGSAIFVHLLGGPATAGCVAIGADAMRFILGHLSTASIVEIR